MSRAVGAFEHRVCVYDHDGEFLDTALPFLTDGLAAGEPVLTVTKAASLELLGSALGEQGGDVDYAEPGSCGRRPAQRVAAYYRYWGGGQGSHRSGQGGRVRILAEPAWAARSAREITAWVRMEAALNVTLASTSISMICLYDARTTDASILADALRTHPVRVAGSRLSPSPQYADPAAFARSCDTGPLAVPPDGAETISFGGDLRGLRRFIIGSAGAHGVAGDRCDMLALAVSEVGGYLKSRWPASASVRTWEQPGVFVCQVRQPGASIGDPFLGLRPAGLMPGDGDGLWLANQICDWIEIRSDAESCTLQLQIESSRDQETAAQPEITYPA